MATILEFRASGDEAGKGRSRRSASAEIVIFPGVRYERWAESEPARPEPASQKPSRGTLKLID